MNWLALDIGGANLKAADGLGLALSRPFPLWQRREELPDALAVLLGEAPSTERIALTMTGELADCFVTKAEGVEAIVQAAVQVAGNRPLHVYLTDGTWASPQRAIDRPLLAAASNWHALARFAGRHAPQACGLLIDIGSTTTDVIPLAHGRPAVQGRTDTERLVSGELVYTGVQRSPVCAVTHRVPWRGRLCPLAQELFATTWDVYLALGDLPEEPESLHTADGRPATRQAAYDRLARAVCADRDLVDLEEVRSMARAIAEVQLEQIAEAADLVVGRLPERPVTVVISGSGEFVARRVLERLKLSCRVLSLAEELGPELSRVATAHALAVLARETGAAS